MRIQFWRIFNGMLFIFAFWTVQGFAQTDPTTAVSLSLNVSATGTLSNTQPVNWWKVTVATDGKLIVNTQAVNTSITLDLYDNQGTRYIGGADNGWGENSILRYNNLMPGTYYVKAGRSSGGGSYTINAAFTPTSLDIEQELNDTPEQAITLDINGSDTAHIGFYGDGYTDKVDWWKVTIPKDGKLFISTEAATPDSILSITLDLYENQGKLNIKLVNTGWGKYSTVNYDNLQQGTYYIKAGLWSKYGSYTIRSSFTPTTLDVETEPNDSVKVALTLDINGSATAHLGFYGNVHIDNVDWWKVTIPKNGKLFITTEAAKPDSNLSITLDLYENQGKNLIKGANAGWGKYSTLNYDNLMPGTYYIKAGMGSNYGSYTIRSSFTPSTFDVETEPNDSTKFALTLDPNGTTTAHLGFYGGGYTDKIDWWKVTMPKDGKLLITNEAAQPDPNLNITLDLYGNQGLQWIKGANDGWGIYSTLNYNNLMAGTYYVKASWSAGYGSYRITSAYSPVHYAIDLEKNDTIGNAVPIAVKTVTTGHIGYFGDLGYDGTDFFSFTVPTGWDTLFVRVKIDTTLVPTLNMYNSVGSVIGGNFPQTYTLVKPAPGTYRLQVSVKSGYGAYAFIVQNSWRADVPILDPTQISPPTNVAAADVPNDQGHRIKLTWTPSVSEKDGFVTWYRILRSRSSVLTTPVSIKKFATIDSLNFWDKTTTVLIDSVAAGVKEYIDQSIPLTGVYYYYWIQSVGLSGVSKPVATGYATAVEDAAPLAFTVSEAWPNPFNPTTTIRYQLPESAHVRLIVYDILGRKVTVLEDGLKGAGVHEVVWNARSGSGAVLGSGVYIWQLKADLHRAQGKMMLLR